MSHPLPQDKTAGYIGLVGGFLVIAITVFTIVQLTNRKFASHEAAPHAPAPAAAPAPASH
jgi:predicted cobalt transporter CbtA